MFFIIFVLFGCDTRNRRIGIYETVLSDDEFGSNEEENDLCAPFLILEYSCEEIESFTSDGSFPLKDTTVS